MSDEAEIRCIFCGDECRVVDASRTTGEVFYVVCENTGCDINGPEAPSPRKAIDAFLNPARLAAKPSCSRQTTIGDLDIRIEAGWVSPGSASFFVIGGEPRRLAFNERATPAQLRELSALCLRSASEAEQAEREAGL